MPAAGLLLDVGNDGDHLPVKLSNLGKDVVLITAASFLGEQDGDPLSRPVESPQFDKAGGENFFEHHSPSGKREI